MNKFLFSGRGGKKGFTLIEILIVVAIISILASVVLVGLGPTQRIGRDAKRLSDLRNVQVALELYFHRCGYYPGAAITAGTGQPCADFSGAPAGWPALESAILDSTTLGIRSLIPYDPAYPGRTYEYASQDGSSYTLKAHLEDVNNPALRDDVDDNDPFFSNGLDCTDEPEPYYCISL